MVWSVMTKQFTAKCPYGKKSHGELSSWRNVRTAKCPTAKSLTAKYPHGEMSLRRSVRTAKCPTTESPTAKSPVTLSYISQGCTIHTTYIHALQVRYTFPHSYNITIDFRHKSTPQIKKAQTIEKFPHMSCIP